MTSEGMPYDDAEIQVVLELSRALGVCESLGEVTNANIRAAAEAVDAGIAKTWMYSVYWHLKVGGVEWVADFPSTQEGLHRAEILHAAMHSYAHDTR